MIEAPLALAFTAGLVATVNPCGFAMLPAYLSYFMGIDTDDDSRRPLRSALSVAALVSVGFIAVFAVAGILITTGFRLVIDVIPWLALAIGIGITLLGIAMLFGFELSVGLPKAKRAAAGRGGASKVTFGASYGVASLSCTLPVFLTVVGTQVTRGSFVSGIATFVAYGLGMSLMLVGVTVALALGKEALVSRLRDSARYINRIAGAILVVAGLYIVWFWTTSLAAGSDALGTSGAFQFVESLSQRMLTTIGENPLAWTIGLVVVIGAGAAILSRRRRPATHDERQPIDH